MYYEVHPLTKTINYWARDFHEHYSVDLKRAEEWMREMGMVVDRAVAMYFRDEDVTMFILKFGVENGITRK